MSRHDCQVGNDVMFANNATLGGHVTVGDHVFFGGLCAVISSFASAKAR